MGYHVAQFSLIKWGLAGSAFGYIMYATQSFTWAIGLPFLICLLVVMAIMCERKAIYEYEQD